VRCPFTAGTRLSEKKATGVGCSVSTGARGLLLLVVLKRYGITDIPLKPEVLGPDTAESDMGTQTQTRGWGVFS
jgi:hypothetical protein